MADVVVYGLTVPTCLLEDIQMDVPQGHTVIVPEMKALQSRDLWRAISQRRVFQLAGPPAGTIAPVRAPDGRLTALEAENEMLRQRLANQGAEFQGKLDSILSLLQSGALVQQVQHIHHGPGSAPRSEAVSGEVPTFIPSKIAPDNADARIDVKKDETENKALTGAAKTLRELRKKGNS